MISNNVKSNVITYSVSTKDINNIFISVENNEVILTVPSYFSNKQIEQILIEKKEWIFNKITNNSKKSIPYVKGTQSYNPEFTNIFGKKYHIDLVYGNITSPKLDLDDKNIQIILPIKFKNSNNSDLLKIMLQKMYTKILDSELDSILENARINLGYAPEDIEIVKQTNYIAKLSNNKLYINPEIVKFDKETIEYVIFHEFCHIQYKTHSKKFYEIMQNFFPNYKQIEENLVDYKF